MTVFITKLAIFAADFTTLTHLILMTKDMTAALKSEKYQSLLTSARALLSGETDEIARMANLSALLHSAFDFWWTGFYRVQDNELVVGPFQGPLACMRIAKGKGVCGAAWAQQHTVIVPDVEQFPGHIACSSESRSEIVVPVWNGEKVAAVLDIDSRNLADFDETDRFYLEQLVANIYGGESDIWFAAGCFWGAQKFFKLVDGVTFTEVGFANGETAHPTYQEVYTDTTGHAECVHVKYNPAVVSLSELTTLYFKIIDPLSINKQGADEGTRYRTGIYYQNNSDFEILTEIFHRQALKLGTPLAVELLPLKCFYTAEEYHQDYLDKNPGGYCHLSPEIFKLPQRAKK